jgi:hypothetical protein
MNRLFELLLENIVFVVIAIGFITSFLRKVKQGQEQSGEQQSQGMPPFGQGSAPSSRKARPARVEHAPVRPQQEMVRAEESLPEQYADWRVLAQGQETSRISSVKGIQENNKPVAAASSLSGEISPAQAAQGIVWAEVFGPPRAKRPYGTRRW